MEKNNEKTTTTQRDTNAVNNLGETRLHSAGSAQEAMEMIEAGADVNKKSIEGYSLLHAALTHGRKDVADVLIAAGADVNAKDNEDRSPIFYAQDVASMGMLIKAVAHVNTKDKYGITPLHEHSSPEATRMLIKAGADVNARTEEGATPLMSARSEETVAALIKAGADVNAKDKYGMSVLHHPKNEKVTEFLIDRGSDTRALSNRGMTPADVARAVHMNNIAEVIERKQTEIEKAQLQKTTPAAQPQPVKKKAKAYI